MQIRADLVVGADGRHSIVCDLAGLEREDYGAPMDVLWLRLSKRPSDASQALGRIQAGRLLVMLDRGDYWQCAYVIPKGGFEDLQRRGLPAFRQSIVELNPSLADRVGEIASWDDVKLLTVVVDRLKRWYRPGLLCIGDAAHAMSPVGGVGINLAIQDAVAAANILAVPLRQGPVSIEVLERGAEAPAMADRDDASRAAPGAEAHHQQCARASATAERAVRGEAARLVPDVCAGFPRA